jgi:hypothetical protein
MQGGTRNSISSNTELLSFFFDNLHLSKHHLPRQSGRLRTVPYLNHPKIHNTDLPSSEPTNKSHSLLSTTNVHHYFGQPLHQPFHQPFHQPVHQPVTKPIAQPASWPTFTNQSANQSAKPSANQSVKQSAKQ